MSKRNENVRTSCSWIDRWALEIQEDISELPTNSDPYKEYLVYKIKSLTSSILQESHRIKRTTWRGDIKCDCYKKVRKQKNFTKQWLGQFEKHVPEEFSKIKPCSYEIYNSTNYQPQTDR